MTDAKENNIKKILVADAASQEVAEKAVAETKKDLDEEMRLRRIKLIKIGVILMLVSIVMIFMTIAWFTMNREVGSSGMGVKTAGLPYIIETRSGFGTYKTQYDSLNTQGEEWKISADHNLENHSGAIEEGEEEPGLEPGDHGSLEFRVSPQNSDTITVDCLFEVKAYLETKVVDENENETTNISVINDSVLTGYLEGHIMLFAGYDEETGKYTGLIDNNNANLQRILTNKTYTKGEDVYTTIYWCWPEHLSDLTGDVTGSANIIYDPDEHEAVIAYIARNKDKFFKDCNDSNAKVLTDLTNLYNTYSNQTYNHYNLKYDNADLLIGNNISYVMLSMQVIND